MTAPEYLKLAMKKRKMRNVDVLNEMNKRHMGTNGIDINRFHISAILNGGRQLSPYMARKFEIVLGLEKYSVVSMVGFPKGEKSMQILKDIDKFEDVEGLKAGI